MKCPFFYVFCASLRRSVVCSNHPEGFREESCPVGMFGEDDAENWDALARITGGKLIDHGAEFCINWSIPVMALVRVCFDDREGNECGELLLGQITVKAKLLGNVGRGKGSRAIAMQEQQHLQSKDCLDLLP
jgi:hypothetical protein